MMAKSNDGEAKRELTSEELKKFRQYFHDEAAKRYPGYTVTVAVNKFVTADGRVEAVVTHMKETVEKADVSFKK